MKRYIVKYRLHYSRSNEIQKEAVYAKDERDAKNRFLDGKDSDNIEIIDIVWNLNDHIDRV